MDLNASTGGSLGNFLGTVGNIGNTAGSIYNAFTKPPATTGAVATTTAAQEAPAPAWKKYLPFILGGVGLLIVVLVMKKR